MHTMEYQSPGDVPGTVRTQQASQAGMSEYEIQALKAELSELKAIVLENQRMIRSVYKRIRLSSTFSVIKWVLIIGVTFGTFYYVQPIFEALFKTYQSVGGVGAGPNNESVLHLLKSL